MRRHDRHRRGDPQRLRRGGDQPRSSRHLRHVLSPALRGLRRDRRQRGGQAPPRYGRLPRRPAVRPLCRRPGRLRLWPSAGAHARARSRALGGGAATVPEWRRSGMSEKRTGEMQVIDDAEQRGRTELWPFWRRVYAQGDPLPRLACTVSRPTYRFDEDEPLPEEYKTLLIRMLRHEGERAGNKSFLGLMASCLDLAETIFPTAEAKLLKAEYLAEELKHGIMFH